MPIIEFGSAAPFTADGTVDALVSELRPMSTP
jgi:hypothetical protein